MFKRMNIFSFFTIIFMMVILSTRGITGELLIEGELTAVDHVDQMVKIEQNWYHLHNNSQIIRNGAESSLAVCQPPEPGFYHWIEAVLNSKEEIINMQVEYLVVEGIIINLQQESLKLEIFKNHSADKGEGEFTIKRDLQEDTEGLCEGDHVVFLAANDMIYRIIKQ